jgi:hypothetical protein
MLSIDIAKLKQSAANKIGGLLGKATGVTAAKEKFETQIDFTLISVANSQTILQNKVSHKSEGSAETVVQTALNQAVQAVIDEAKRRK